jgi:hypothetical protein
MKRYKPIERLGNNISKELTQAKQSMLRRKLFGSKSKAIGAAIQPAAFVPEQRLIKKVSTEG